MLAKLSINPRITVSYVVKDPEQYKTELIASFIIERIEEFIMYGNCPSLINSVWNYNTNTHISENNKIYKLPWCPNCGDKKDNEKIDLPWSKEFNYE